LSAKEERVLFAPFRSKNSGDVQSEWMLDLLTAIAASLKDSLTVG
jgi:succinylglutamate desuccinylase